MIPPPFGVILGVFALLLIITICWVAWITFIELTGVDSRSAEAVDTADRALAAVQAVINHLAETEPATTGRHALAPAVAMTKEQLL